MKLSTLLAILGLAFFGFACTDTEHYPVSGEECSENDPVKGTAVQECVRTIP